MNKSTSSLILNKVKQGVIKKEISGQYEFPWPKEERRPWCILLEWEKDDYINKAKFLLERLGITK